MMNIFYIMAGGSLKNHIFMGLHKKPVYSRELPKKQTCTICRFNLRRGALWKGAGGDLGRESWYPMNAQYELASLADSYASSTCFLKSHSDYTVNIYSTLLPRKYM